MAEQTAALSLPCRMPLPVEGHFRGNRRDIFVEEGHPLSVMTIRGHPDLELHTHDFVELVLILGGEARHWTRDASYPLQSGDVFVIKPGFAHGYAETRSLSLCNILFDPNGLGLPQSELSRLPGYHGFFDLEPSFRGPHRFQSRLFLAPAALHRAMDWAEMIEQELAEKQDGYRGLTVGLLIRIIGFLSRSYTGMTGPASRTLLAVSKVVSYIEHHYREALSMKSLAPMAGMSERTLQRYFYQAFGVPPVDYLNRVRVSKACQFLAASRMGVSEAAAAVGIPDSSYFARVFRRFTGIAPSEYRKSSRHLQSTIHPRALRTHPRSARIEPERIGQSRGRSGRDGGIGREAPSIASGTRLAESRGKTSG